MSTFELVTSFSVDGYHCYGQNMIDSFVENTEGASLTIYHESQPNVDFHEKLTWRNLDHNEHRQKFIEDWGNDPDKVGSYLHPNSQAIRFCHKVFAIADAAKKCEAEWLVWVDADTRFTHKISQARLERACPGGADLSFLGRTSAPYTECGFVGYRVAARTVLSMIDDMEHYYTSNEIFSRPKTDWHDSKCFDVCRHRSSIPSERQHNLSKGIQGWHVWPNTCLESWVTHNKGPKRKQQAYGHTVK